MSRIITRLKYHFLPFLVGLLGIVFILLCNLHLHLVIFPSEPLYHVSPKVFGCTFFVHDVSPNLDKLSTKVIECVFLGFSHLQKGYKFYSPTTKRYYMSTDVTFFEETPFFSSTNGISNLVPFIY